ncbi:hypothetical protein DVH05_000233 [Phytophthora capsici]|nr:hypothetical protein DVH05_000233 [Phytophthora capsici]
MVGGRDGRSRGGRGRGPGGTGNRSQGGGRGRGRSSSQSAESGRGRGSRGGHTGGRSKGPSLPPNPSSMQFIRALKKCPNNRLKQQIEQLEKSWLSCWQDVAHLHFDAVKTLLSALARLPFSVSIAPPPLSCISQAVSTLLSQIGRNGGGDEDFDGNDDTLEGVELVERVVTRLLKFTWGIKRGEVKDALDDMIAEVDGSLNVRLKTHRPVRGRLTALLSEIEKPWSIKVKAREETEAHGELVVQDWRHPSVAWLADFKNFQPALLPRLQLRNSNEGRVYDSSDEYFTTIVKLWIGMTFVEGNNALLPRCTVKVADKVCDQPLWPFPGKQSSVNCKNSQCRRNSTFVCANRQHSKGLCDGCAGEYQKRLRGPPSKYSSTHIYDGSIAQVKYDGTMTIEQVASRKPPLNPIHWKTTKRLSSPNLIGIVRLPSREAPLQTCDEIYWAEIIFQGKSFDEYKAREHGRLSLRLLQYLNEPGNAMLTHNPAVGDAVAIIDCQTFVPEFVPVLKALEMQRQMPVPFQEGALLNLCEHNNFHSKAEPDEGVDRFENDSDYDNNSDYDDEDMYPTTDISRLSTRELIRKVIQVSLLDPIVDIRRDGGLRNELETRLLQLVNSATLDPGQLRSFTESLMYPVHCTQGPPGTGKSYLGVVVVRALIIIRDLWKRKNREVGDPPILVLSYKNHAIDEFLLDLLRSEPTLDHGPTRRQSFARYYVNNGFKKLIRIGGGCNEPELEPYRERNAAFSDPRVRKVSKRIEECQDLREQWHKFRDCFSPIFEAQATVAGGTKSLTSNEWKIVQSAVPVAASAVTLLQKLSDLNDDKKMEADTEEKPATDSVSAIAEAEAASPLQAATTVLTKKPSLTNSDIAQLYEGIKHYDPAIDPLAPQYSRLYITTSRIAFFLNMLLKTTCFIALFLQFCTGLGLKNA